jgi:NitT/TauT family transport system permease protein
MADLALRTIGRDMSGRTEPEPNRESAAVPSPAPPPPASFARHMARWLLLRRGTMTSAALGAAAIAVFVLAWHIVTTNGMNLYVRFGNVPSPEMVADSARAALSSGIFADHVIISVRRVALGFLAATAVAVPMGLLMGRFGVLRNIFFPLAEVLRPIPAIAWVPMSIMLWPTNEESIVFITFLGAFFPILVNTLHGMSTIDPVLVRAAQCLGARETSIFREVFLPGALPHIFTGLTVGMGVAWVSLIAAEMISGQFGIGYFTWEAYSLIQYSDIALGMICIGVLGLLSSWAIRGVAYVSMPWAAR